MLPGAVRHTCHESRSQVHMIDDTPTLTFAKSSYHLETEEAERVSVDQVSHRSTV